MMFFVNPHLLRVQLYGPGGARTHDPYLVEVVLSQLSYGTDIDLLLVLSTYPIMDCLIKMSILFQKFFKKIMEYVVF